MACKMCKKRGKNWEGSDPNCYFDGDDNWNCATVNAIRDICGDWGETPCKGVVKMGVEDENMALVSAWDCDLGEEDEYPSCLYVQWYKRRGRTEVLLLLGEGMNRRPTEDELLMIINHRGFNKGVSTLESSTDSP